ncbi:hypothetical protein [Sinomicrobium oceani]|uniref:hypothetical protein n=1 Tax=Sinomicrobium oceani TaxID=1150368 RepID=UPI00227D05ED|nr:hypothetical protein [Sinomicrobium oceani]
MKVKLSEIFGNTTNRSMYSRDELLSLDVKMEFVKRLARYYAIPYLPDGNDEHNLCYANSSTVRFEYRSTFSKRDVITYLLSTLKQDTFHLGTDEVIFSKSV